MSPEHDSPGKPRLLIVDDDPMNCEIIKIRLEVEGYACATLSDPERILEVIAEESPTLVLMDFHLGPYEGLDVLRAIRSREERKRLGVIMMSGMDYRRESEQAGADGFVLKPFSLEELATVICELLEQQEKEG
jgi:two-component system phosphate regulon response regulator PhoB